LAENLSIHLRGGDCGAKSNLNGELETGSFRSAWSPHPGASILKMRKKGEFTASVREPTNVPQFRLVSACTGNSANELAWLKESVVDELTAKRP